MKSNDYPKILILSIFIMIIMSGFKGDRLKSHKINAQFFTEAMVEIAPNPDQCSNPFILLNIQEGSGRDDFLGEFTGHFEFCVQVFPDEEDPENPAKNKFKYVSQSDHIGNLTTSHGDQLFLELVGVGKIVPTKKEGYLYEFKDKVRVVGGTGKFEEASGKLVFDSYNKGERTDHYLNGSIRLP